MATQAFDAPRDWTRRWVGGGSRSLRIGKPRDERVAGLVDQFFSTLGATYQQIKASGEDLSHLAGVTSQIEDLLAGERSWRNAYHIEQLMVPLYTGDRLDVELQRRLLEAERISPPIAGYYARPELAKDASPERKHALLARLINDLQWRYENRQVEAYYRGILAQRIGWAFIIATFLFLLPVVLIFVNELKSVPEWASLFIVMASGLMGAAFSMLLSANNRTQDGDIEDLRTARRWPFIFSRAFVGIGASLILYYCIAAKIVEGPVFPKIEALFDKSTAAPDFRSSFALLIVACFLAGFSERLVPNLLSRAEKNADLKQTPPPRPTTAG
jgi:hypothetical protein